MPANENLTAVADLYLGLETGCVQPLGLMSSTGYWFPLPCEVEECCKAIKLPQKYSFSSLKRHCKAIKHIALKYDVGEKELRDEINKERAFLKINGLWFQRPKQNNYENAPDCVKQIIKWNLGRKTKIDSMKKADKNV